MASLAAAACAHAKGSPAELTPAPTELAPSPKIASGAASELAPRSPVVLGTPAARAQLDACYAAALRREPQLAVHTDALYFMRGRKIVFADLELPGQPELARCLRDAIMTWEVPGPPGMEAPDSLGVGGFAIDLGPALEGARPVVSRRAREERRRRAQMEALRSGALSADDPHVQQAFALRPAWPTPEYEQQMQACYETAARAQPGLVVHRSVTFLARGSKMLVADLSIPEAPQLASCLLERINTWRAPFADLTDRTVISTFFVDLGGPPEYPPPDGDLCAELTRRSELLATALERGLISPQDPLIQNLNLARPSACSEPRAGSGQSHESR